MIRTLNVLSKALRRLRRNESGAATVEFVVVFPFFVAIFVSAYEVAIMNMRAVMLERATDVVVREIRLNAGNNMSYQTVLDDICDLAGIIPDCAQTTKIELRAVDKTTWAGLSMSVDCIDRAATIQPAVTFVHGQQNELMLMRVCSVVDPIFPTVGVGRSIPVDATGAYQVIASTAFVNEPQWGG